MKSQAATLDLVPPLPANEESFANLSKNGDAPCKPPGPPIALLGIPFDNLTIVQAIEQIAEMVASRRPHYLVTANVDFLVQAQTDIELRRILFDAHLVLCDGTPLVWASRFLGNPLPERVAGADLVPLLIRVAAQRGYRLFLLGATPESAERAAANLRRQHPDLLLAGHYSPPFNKLLEMDHAEIRRRITEAAPDLLLVSFGCPKQEKWIAMHYRSLGVPVAVGVGATIDFLAGQVKRAPAWMQHSGAEWLFRLAQEPRRLFRRYAKDLWVFGRRIVAQWWEFRPRDGFSSEAGNGASDGLSDSETRQAGHHDIRPGVRCIIAPESLDLFAGHRGAFDVDRLLPDGAHCVLQMKQVQRIDSTGVGLLIRLQKRLHASGRQLVLLSPGLAVQRALKLMRLDDFFEIASDMITAIQHIERRVSEKCPALVLDDSPPPRALVWQGEITAVNTEQVWNLTRANLIAAAETGQPEVAIDLSAVRFIDSSGLGAMVRARKLAQHHGTRLVFTHVQPAVLNVIKLARLNEFLLGGMQQSRR